MRKPIFTGVCTALVTPFIENEINYPLLDQLLKHQLDNGVRTVVLSGTTGEAPTLSDTEKRNLINRAKSCCGNDCTIIAGTGTNSTEHTLALSIDAQKAGADALLVVAPYYNKSNNEGLYAHFATIARAVDIPIIIYNVPSRTGIDIPVSVYKRLSGIPNIVGVKEASTDIVKILRIRQSCPSDFYVWSGNDDQTVPVMSVGGQGIISVVSNVFPKEMVLMTDAALQGDYQSAAKWQTNLQYITDLMFCEVNPIPVKYAMKKIGFDCGDCRLPLGPLNETDRAKLDAFFQ